MSNFLFSSIDLGGVSWAGHGTGLDVEEDEAFFEAEKIDKL